MKKRGTRKHDKHLVAFYASEPQFEAIARLARERRMSVADFFRTLVLPALPAELLTDSDRYVVDVIDGAVRPVR